MALRRDAKVELLKSVPLFSSCSKTELRELALVADELVLDEGRTLVREGDTGRDFFTLVDGTVRVTQGARKLADLGPGDWFGEIALLTNAPRTGTVVATSSVRLLVVTDRAFRRVVEAMPSIAIKVLASVADRLARDAHS